MAHVYPALDGRLTRFIEAQRVFFVATAPLDNDGHINLSPKGLDSLRILSPNEIFYIDLIGSGAETIAHLRENGRIVVMFCAFEGPPNIVRLHGRGTVFEPQDPSFDELRAHFSTDDKARAIIRITLDRISTSCGFGVPLMKFEGERPQLTAWSKRKDPEGLDEYQREKNAESIDGLPALRWVKRG